MGEFAAFIEAFVHGEGVSAQDWVIETTLVLQFTSSLTTWSVLHESAAPRGMVVVAGSI